MALAQVPRPALVAPRAADLEAVRMISGGGFDVDAWHVMDQRDNELIADEILNGAGSHSFVYDFEVAGKQVVGVSVIGARHLANHYRGLKHRLVASQQKINELFTFTSYPAENMPMSVSCAVVHELAGEPDYYSILVEVSDIKTGNAIQVERREPRFEFRRDGSQYERPNFPTIAQSKAYRNAVLALVPQDVVIVWREQMLKLKKGETITVSVLQEKRQNVIRFAAANALQIERQAVERLTLDQIAGLGDAAREGRLPAFVNAARALGLVEGTPVAVEATMPTPETPSQPRRGRPRAQREDPAPSDAAPTQQAPTAPSEEPTQGIPAAETVEPTPPAEGEPARTPRVRFD